MKILFLCGCIELGKDGVGDYTRSLSLHLVSKGVEVQIISLVDKFVENIQDDLIELPNQNITVKTKRLPYKKYWNEKVEIVRNELQDFIPDLISFQVVPFAYNPYGILRNILPFFLKIAKGFRTHIMFHELWIGNSLNEGIKEKIIGFLERRYLLKFIHELKPIRIHTSCDLYIFLLKKYDIKALKLPIFSNIKLSDITIIERERLLKRLNLEITIENKDNVLIFTFFGTIHAEWCPEKLMLELLKIKKVNKKKIILASIGRSNDQIWNSIKNLYQEEFTFIRIGELSEEEVSIFFQLSDFGISSYPDILVDKSGSIAAFRLHGLPVVLSRNELMIPGFKLQSQTRLLLLGTNEIAHYLDNRPTNKIDELNAFDVKYVAQQFLNDIKI